MAQIIPREAYEAGGPDFGDTISSALQGLAQRKIQLMNEQHERRQSLSQLMRAGFSPQDAQYLLPFVKNPHYLYKAAEGMQRSPEQQPSGTQMLQALSGVQQQQPQAQPLLRPGGYEGQAQQQQVNPELQPQSAQSNPVLQPQAFPEAAQAKWGLPPVEKPKPLVKQRLNSPKNFEKLVRNYKLDKESANRIKNAKGLTDDVVDTFLRMTDGDPVEAKKIAKRFGFEG